MSGTSSGGVGGGVCIDLGSSLSEIVRSSK